MNDIEFALDGALEVAKECRIMGLKTYVNPLFSGRAGYGKTERIYEWAEKNGINIFYLDAKALDPTDFSGIPAPDKDRTSVVRLASTELDALNEKNTVLFLDEFNRADPAVRAILLTLIKDHCISDPQSKSHTKYFDNMLFTIAAVNPVTPKRGSNYNVYPLDMAEVSRFKWVNIDENTGSYADYFRSFFQGLVIKSGSLGLTEYREKYEGELCIVDALFNSSDFWFDTVKEEYDAEENSDGTTCPRTLMNLLVSSGGSMRKFIEEWDNFCNPIKKPAVERILKNYADKVVKGNSVFAPNKTYAQKFLDYLAQIGG